MENRRRAGVGFSITVGLWVIGGCTQAFTPAVTLPPSPDGPAFDGSAVLVITEEFESFEVVGNSNVHEVRYAFGGPATELVQEMVGAAFADLTVRRSTAAGLVMELLRTPGEFVLVPRIKAVTSNTGGFNVEVELTLDLIRTGADSVVTFKGVGRGTARLLVGSSLGPTGEEALRKAAHELRESLWSGAIAMTRGPGA